MTTLTSKATTVNLSLPHVAIYQRGLGIHCEVKNAAGYLIGYGFASMIVLSREVATQTAVSRALAQLA